MAEWLPDICHSDSDSESEFFDEYTGREIILFVIDSHLSKNWNRMMETLHITRNAFLSGVFVNNKDLLAVVFDGTKHNPLPHEPDCLTDIFLPEHCAVLLPLRQLTISIAKFLINYVETLTQQSFESKYGCNDSDSSSSSFVSMLRLCRDLTRTCNFSADHITIAYFTDRCTPCSLDTDDYHRATYKAADLKDENINFQVIPMIDEFNYDIFYREFLCLVLGESMDTFVPISAQKLREIMADRKMKHYFKGRSLGHFKFLLGPDVAISAQYFSYFKKNKWPSKIFIRRTDNMIVRRKLQNVIQTENKDIGNIEDYRTVNVRDAWYEIKVGNETIRLSNEQVNRVHNLNPPGMMLLGFKPLSCLSEVLHVKSCHFMYPDNSHIVGSTKLFRALWERCKVRNVVAICLFMCKRKAKPFYVALVPVNRVDVEDNSYYSLLSNDGFKIIYLPFADNVRDIDLSAWNSLNNQASDDALKVCEKVVSKFRLKYAHNIIANPHFNELNHKLLALALNAKFERIDSQYYPNLELQEELLYNVIEKFNSTFPIGCTHNKRRSPAPEGSKKKKVKH